MWGNKLRVHGLLLVSLEMMINVCTYAVCNAAANAGIEVGGLRLGHAGGMHVCRLHQGHQEMCSYYNLIPTK